MDRWISTIKQVLKDCYYSHLKPAFAKDSDILLVIVLLALALRLYFALTFSAGPSLGFKSDFILASQGGPVDSLQGPMYIHFLRLMFSMGGKPTVFVFQAIAGTVSVILLYYIATRICNRKAGLLAAVLAAVYPGAILQVISATPAALLVLTSVVLMAVLLSRGEECLRAIVSAGVVAVGILLEPMMVFLVPGSLFAVRKRVVFAIVLIGLLLPWTLRNSIVDRKPVPVYRIEAYCFDFDKFHPSMLRGRWHLVEKLYSNTSAITGKGWATGGDKKEESKRNSTYAAAYAYSAIMLFGLFGLAKRYRKTHRQAVLPFVSYSLMLIVLTVFTQRYRIVLEPLFITYSAALIFGQRESGDFETFE